LTYIPLIKELQQGGFEEYLIKKKIKPLQRKQ